MWGARGGPFPGRYLDRDITRASPESPSPPAVCFGDWNSGFWEWGFGWLFFRVGGVGFRILEWGSAFRGSNSGSRVQE